MSLIDLNECYGELLLKNSRFDANGQNFGIENVSRFEKIAYDAS